MFVNDTRNTRHTKRNVKKKRKRTREMKKHPHTRWHSGTWHAPTTESKAFRHRVLTWNLAFGHVRRCSPLLDSKHVATAARPRCFFPVSPSPTVIYRRFSTFIPVARIHLYAFVQLFLVQLSSSLTVWVPGVFEKILSKNAEQRDSICLNWWRREPSSTIALFYVEKCQSAR